MQILGIDPGLNGALAMWDGADLTLLEIPSVKSSGRGRDVDWERLYGGWIDLSFTIVDRVYLEKVNVRPGEGRSSAFKFGMVYGGLMGMCAATWLPVTLVTPQKWKKHYGLSKDKEKAVLLACQLFRNDAHKFYGPRGGLKDGVAEAALIAKYGYDQMMEKTT